MKTRLAPSPELLRLVDQQGAALTREQALLLGGSTAMLRRLISDGRWSIPTPGIVVVLSGPRTIETDAWIGVLAGGEGAAVAGAAAAHLHGLGDEPDVIDVALPHRRGRRDVGRWHFRELGTFEVRGQPPRLTVEETTLMLCRDDPANLEATLVNAVQRRRTTPKRLLTALESQERHPDRRAIVAALSDVAEGAESPSRSTICVWLSVHTDCPPVPPASPRSIGHRCRVTSTAS